MTLAKDGTVALDWWVPSHDGKYVAYGTSAGGSEISTLHIIDDRDAQAAARHHRAHARGEPGVEAR